MIKNIDMGISCDSTLNQLDRLIETTSFLFFDKDMKKKRHKNHSDRLAYDPLNQCKLTRHTNNLSSKRMKGNPEGHDNVSRSDVSCPSEISAGANVVDGESFGTTGSSDDSCSEQSENLDWIIE